MLSHRPSENMYAHTLIQNGTGTLKKDTCSHTHTHARGYSVIKELFAFFNHFYMYKIFRKDPAWLATGRAKHSACLTWVIDKLLKNNLSKAPQLIQRCQAAVATAASCFEDPPAVADDLTPVSFPHEPHAGALTGLTGGKRLNGIWTIRFCDDRIGLRSKCTTNVYLNVSQVCVCVFN